VGEDAVSDERIEPEPAIGTPASPAFGEKSGKEVQLHVGEFKDGRWSYLYGEDTGYRGAEADPEALRKAARDAREGELPKIIQGPIINPPVWTWEIPLYFWFGGIAAGSSFVALACDLAGDERSAAVARKVALGALGPSPVLLIMDLRRPERFVNMLRIFKPRSPMSMGAWALTLFGNLAAATAATGAAACRLVLVATGLPVGHPTRRALGTVETGAMTSELVLSIVNERRHGPLASGLGEGRAGALFKFAKWAVRAGLALRFARSRGPWVHHCASALYLAAGLAFRYAWVGAGRHSARDDEVVAKMARERGGPAA
jgi:hypothetical protein